MLIEADCCAGIRVQRTSRKIQQEMEMEPRIPERASWRVRGISREVGEDMILCDGEGKDIGEMHPLL